MKNAVEIKTNENKYSVFIRNNKVLVVDFPRDINASTAIADCVGDEFGRVYAVEGHIVKEFAYGSRGCTWTKSQVVEFVNDRITESGSL